MQRANWHFRAVLRLRNLRGRNIVLNVPPGQYRPAPPSKGTIKAPDQSIYL
jgi:hypothetical protein